MKETYRQIGMRRKLVQHLRTKGIKDESVLEAIGNIPRHRFMDTAFIESAYLDKAFPIDAGQTISQPFTVAMQTQLLELSRGQKVLEIGTGSGYQCAVLCELGAQVFSIERQKTLFSKSGPLLNELGYRPKLFFGDGYKGKHQFAPFDKIIITCGAPFIPQDLIDQLKVGGIMVIPVGEEQQVMKRVVKMPDGQINVQEFGDYQFVPMLKNKAMGI